MLNVNAKKDKKGKNLNKDFKTSSYSVDKNIINLLYLEDIDNINKFPDYTIGDDINLYSNISKIGYLISYIRIISFI